jgi:hypothetical protein
VVAVPRQHEHAGAACPADTLREVSGTPQYCSLPVQIYALQPYVDVLGRTGGLVPEFVNPKYADATKQRFQRPTRLECMMQASWRTRASCCAAADA